RKFVPLAGLDSDVDAADVVPHADTVPLLEAQLPHVGLAHLHDGDLVDVAVGVLALIERRALTGSAAGSENEGGRHDYFAPKGTLKFFGQMTVFSLRLSSEKLECTLW